MEGLFFDVLNGKGQGGLRDRVVRLMKDNGPQSVNDLCVNLRITNGSSRSVLVKLHEAGKIERIAKGIYRAKGDDRGYNRDKPKQE